MAKVVFVASKPTKKKSADDPSSYWCSVPGCTSDGRKKKNNLTAYPWMKGVTFHAYPGPRRNPSLRRRWLNQIIREENYAPGRHHRVCSLHFVNGGPSEDHPVPTLFPRNNYGEEPPMKRSRNSIEKRKILCDVNNNSETDVSNLHKMFNEVSTMNVTVLADGCVIPIPVCNECTITTTDMDHKFVNPEKTTTVYQKELKTDHEYSKAHKKTPDYRDMAVQTDLSMEDIRIMEAESTSYSKGNVLRELFVEKTTASDASVRQYFGLPSILILFGIFNILENACSTKLKYWSGKHSTGEKRYESRDFRKPGPRRKLSMFHEFLITLLRIRLGLNIHILSDIFGVSEFRVSQIFSTWTNYMYQVFSPQIKWPSMQKIRKFMPKSFKNSFPGTRVIIDCTEVFIQKPRSPTAQCQTYSNYKNHNTFKSLVGITPSGAFSFVSEFWGGNVSDRFITANSGFLDKISPGDEVMADRGFIIADYLLERKAKLIMPPFTKKCKWGKGKRLTAIQIKKTRKIAKVRIHVERAIQRLKTFRILSGVMPLSLKPLANQILVIVAFFCNIASPLVTK